MANQAPNPLPFPYSGAPTKQPTPPVVPPPAQKPPAKKPPAQPAPPAPLLSSPLPPFKPQQTLAKQGMNISMPDINKTVQEATNAHRNVFGFDPTPGLMFDVIRGKASGIVGDVHHLFDVPVDKTTANVRQTAAPAMKTISALDPAAPAALAAAQGHPLTVGQRVAFGLTKGQITYAQAHQRLVQAGILPKLEIPNDQGDIFNQVVGGGYLFAFGLMAAAPITAIQEGAAVVKGVKTGSFTPVMKTNEAIAKGVAVKTYNDWKAVVTGDTAYLRNNPDAYWNVGFTTLAGVGLASKLAVVGAVTRDAGLAAGAREMLLPKPPAAKVMRLGGKSPETLLRDYRLSEKSVSEAEGRTRVPKEGFTADPNPVEKIVDMQAKGQKWRAYAFQQGFKRDEVRDIQQFTTLADQLGIHDQLKDGVYGVSDDTVLGGASSSVLSGATVDALNFSNPIVRLADNMRTDRMKARAAAGKEPLLASLLRATDQDWAADFVSKNFSYEAKFRRETEALRRTQYRSNIHLARQLDTITASSIDTASALEDVPKPVKNNLSLGELKAMQVLAQGGEWREALATMVRATTTWRDAEILRGRIDIAKDHSAQLAAFKLAEGVLRDAEENGFSKTFQKAFPLVRDALEKTTTVKIDQLGLAPETADLRNLMEYEVYKSGKEIPNRKKIRVLVRATESRIAHLQKRRGWVPPELKAQEQEMLGQVADQRIKEGLPGETPKAVKGEEPVPETKSADLVKLEKKYSRIQEKIQAATAQEHPELPMMRKRLDSLNRLLEETQTRLENAERREGAFRLPVVNRTTLVRSGLSSDFPRRGDSPFGLYKPEIPGEIGHSFTGKGLLAGDIRLDFTNLAARDLSRTVRAAMWMDDYNMKSRMAVKQLPEGPTSRFYAPIRSKATVSPKIREMLNNILEPGLTTEDIAALTPEEVESLNTMAYARLKVEPDGSHQWIERIPGKEPGTFVERPIRIKDYEWYDTRANPENRPPTEPTGLAKALNSTYNLIGRPRIFLAPRYLLNLPSNWAMNAIHENVFTPVALAAAYKGKAIYGADTVARIDEAVGWSRTRSLGPTSRKGIANRGMNAITQGWHFLTDVHSRRAAFMYEAWKKGYTSADDMKALVTDPANVKDFAEVTRRAEKAMVELDNLTWAEQQHLRHMVFIWPWRSRQAIWSVRTLFEHPAQASILAMIGENALESDKENEPYWMQTAIKKYLAMGYVITGWNPDGSPKGVAAGQINTFSGLMDVLGVTGAGFSQGIPFNFDSLGPGLQLFYEAITGNDQFGRALPHKGSPLQVFDAFVDVAVNLQPITQSYQRGGRAAKNKPIPPFNPASRDTIMTRINAAQRQVALSPGWMNGYGLLFTGGTTPRIINRWKMLYDYYHGLSVLDRHKFERKLIFQVLNVQSQMMKQPIPEGVHTAVDVQNELSYQLNVLAKNGGYTDGVPDRIKDDTLLAVLSMKGLITNQQVREEKKAVEAIVGASPTDHQQVRNSWMVKYAGGKELAQWDQNIKTLAGYNAVGLQKKSARLGGFGLPSPIPDASQSTYYYLGRRVIAYEEKVRTLTREAHNEPDPLKKANILAERDNYVADAGEPTVINGTRFPSVVKLSYADATAQSRHTQIVSAASHKWSSLSGFDKEVLTGKHVDPIVDKAWAAINQRMALEKSLLPPGKSLPTGLRQYYINKVMAQSPAFKADYKFGQKPLAERLESYRPIVKSPYADGWNLLLSTATKFADGLIKAGWVHTSGTPDWTAIQKEWASKREVLMPQLQQLTSPGFMRELNQYVKSNPTFIADLVRP